MKLTYAAKPFFLFLAIVVGLAACKKETDLILSPSELETGSYLKRDQAVKLTLNYNQINNESATINVSGYGEEVDSVVVYASTNNSSNRTTWRRIKAFKTTDNKATLVVTATELATALGRTPSQLNPGTQYTMFNEVVTKSGRRFSLSNTNSEFESSPDYAMAMRWTVSVICPFDPAASAGTYTIISDPWDGGDGEEVEITTTANSIIITYLYPYAGFFNQDARPVTVQVDPATGAATMARQIYGGYGAAFADFSGAGTGFVFSCTGRISLSVNHVAAGGTGANYGNYTIVLQKN
jgi:hypothetical protein